MNLSVLQSNSWSVGWLVGCLVREAYTALGSDEKCSIVSIKEDVKKRKKNGKLFFTFFSNASTHTKDENTQTLLPSLFLLNQRSGVTNWFIIYQNFQFSSFSLCANFWSCTNCSIEFIQVCSVFI